MRILPGKPKAHLQSLCAGEWSGVQLIAYASGTALVILGGVNELIQTIYHDEELSCVTLNEDTGAIAVSSKHAVTLYKPSVDWKSLRKWIFHNKIELQPPDENPNFLSWGPGPDLELLIGGASLSLWTSPSNSASLVRSWCKRLANPAKYAIFSFDGSLVASVGFYDRLVKVWRRQSFVSGDPQFDFTYLPHAATVTSVYWRRPLHREMSFENVLYTFTNDQVLRVWSPSDVHDPHLLHLWASVELGGPDSIFSPYLPPEKSLNAKTRISPSKFGAILDSKVFKLATEAVVQNGPQGPNGADALQRVLEIANRSPELCVIVDSQGKLSVWGLENVGVKGTRTTNAFRIVQNVEMGPNILADGNFVQLYAFSDKSAQKGLTFIMHIFDGEVFWLESRLDELLDPSPRRARLKNTGFWYGHSEAIDSLYRTPNGRSLLSSSKEKEHVLWVCGKMENQNVSLIKKSSLSLNEPDPVRETVILEDGNFLITLHSAQVILWDCRLGLAKEMQRCKFQIDGEWLCLILLPEVKDESHIYHIAAVTSYAEGIAWEVQAVDWIDLPEDGQYLKEASRFDLDMKSGLKMMLPVDPVGWEFTLSGNLDKFNPDVALSVSEAGLLRSWTARVSTRPTEVSWLETGRIETMINNASLARGSSIRKIAVVDEQRTELTIWDNRGQQLEFRSRYGEKEIVQDLDWTCTPDSQSILAVGFPHRVLLLSQLRYDYLNAGPAWAPFREISIEGITTHPIGDSIWLENGTLVIGAGNQLFLNSKYLPPTKTGDPIVDNIQLSSGHQDIPVDIFEAVSRLNGPVPIYHPQFLQQCILAGKIVAVEKILISLYKSLKGYDRTEPLKLGNFLDMEMEELLDEQDEACRPPLTSTRSYNVNIGSFDGYDEDAEQFDEELSTSLSSLLKEVPIPYLTGQEQIALAGINECVSEVTQHKRSIDENGSRYLLFFKQHNLRRDATPDHDLAVSFREVVWAFHSNSQEILVDLVSKTFQHKMTWSQAREAGIFMWLQDIEAVRKQFEILARNHYTRTEDRNPIDCALYYLALKKKTVLVGLWRMAAWHPEQRATHKLLNNNFDEERWKSAALKNAYALMGKRRFEYAAAFFLLADSVKDAINICFNQMNDMQLAIAIARVYEGDDGPNLRNLLNDKVIPLAAREGNKWLATWAFWMLGRKDLAVRSIISPIHHLVNSPESPELDSKLFLTEDPALVILYQQIRDKTLQTLRGAEKISPSAEFQFVIHTARLYDRMGCDILALGLVKNWEFLQAEASKPLIEHDPRRFRMRRRSSVTVADLVDENSSADGSKSMTGSKSGLVKPPPSVFEEPNMDMFDHFDF